MDGQQRQLDMVYTDRANAVQLAARLAMMVPGCEAGVRTDDLDPNWPVVAIRLADGKEMAWHIRADDLVLTNPYTHPYDGHTDEEKAQRIKDFCKS